MLETEPHLAFLNWVDFNSRRPESGSLAVRGKEKSLSRCLGSYYKLPKSDPNAVFFAPKCCLLAASFVRDGQCDNSLYPCTFILNQLDWSNN